MAILQESCDIVAELKAESPGVSWDIVIDRFGVDLPGPIIMVGHHLSLLE
jgi:hypothetical protein